MKQLTSEQFDALLKAAPIKPRLKRDIKFVTSTEKMESTDWLELELLPIWNKSKNGGILLVQPDEDMHIIPFEASNSGSGGSMPIICDFCYTWQSYTSGGFVTFYPDKSNDNSFSLLCCLDLACSSNVRTKTPASLKSRAQLREDMTNEDRVERLKKKLRAFISSRGLAGAHD